jgi:formyl-CoA transferase
MPALDGVKVLDLTQYEAGTTSTQYLAWFGADVLKVEQPGVGDPGRWTEGGDRDSLYFLTFNHNKRSVAIDLRKPEGRDLFLQLARKCDVVVENFTLGTMEKLGIGYDVLQEVNPAIIYATIKGFGTYGPYSGFKCYDMVAQAAGGAFSVTGEEGGPPMRPGATVADTGSGMHCAMGILAAYIQRLRTGKGQVVEISMQETVTNFMRMPLSTRERRPGPVPRRGNRALPPTDLYPCAPGGPNDYIYIMIVTSRMWDALITAMDRPDLGLDPRFATPRDRLTNGDALFEEVAAWTRQRTKFEAMEHLASRGVPCGAAYDSEDILHDKHLHARGQIRTINHPVRGEIEMLAPPVHLSESDVDLIPAPLLGQHTAEVLSQELGLDGGRLAELAAAGVIQVRERAQSGALA